MTALRLPDDLQAILFDKDGTLIDYERTWGQVNAEVVRMAAAGDEKLASRLLQAGGIDPLTGCTLADSLFASGNTIEVAEMLNRHGSPFSVAELTERLDRMFQDAAGCAVPLTDLPSLFGGLRARDLAIGIASSDSETAIHATARGLKISDLVDFICGYDSGHGVKPKPGMVHAFCKATGSEPSRVAVVGDNRHDMDMARAAGAIAIAVLSGTGTEATLIGCSDFCVASVADLPALLGG